MNRNMYQLSAKQWNPFVGCEFDCTYCKTSFQAQAKRQKHNCIKCYNFEPHEHQERLNQPLPKTGYMQFIFTCASGDVAFCHTDYLRKIVARMRKEKDKTFLLQSKAPVTFTRVDRWPDNVILGTTLETTAGLNNPSLAPKPLERFLDMRKLRHSRKMITIEPIIQLNSSVIAEWINDISPCMVWMGYNSKARPVLPEPTLEEFQKLHFELSKMGIPVILKTVRG